MFFERNQDIVRISDNIKIKKGFCRFSKDYTIVISKEIYPGLIFEGSDEKITIHSNYYPQKEAERLIENFQSERDTIVVLGLALGYYLLPLINKYPEKKVIIIEPDKHLFNLFLTYNDLSQLNQKNITFLIGFEDWELRQFFDIPFNFTFDILEFKQLLRIFPAYYSLIKKRIAGERIFVFDQKWKYSKLTNTSCRIMFLDASYVLARECVSAINSLGHQVKYLHIDKQEADYEVFIKNFLKEIYDFKPDFILTINHLGFDQEGKLTELLSEMEVPFVSWYVDSPTVVLQSFEQNISDFCNIFVWDRDYIADLKSLSYKNVDYLPLATSTEIFHPMPVQKSYEVFFVGSSMVFGIHKNLRSMVHRSDLLRLLDITARKFLDMDTRYVDKAIETLIESGEKYSFEDNDQKEDFKAAVIWRATQIYRLSGIEKLAPFYPVIFGDPNWDRFLGNDFRIGRELLYYEQMPLYYNKAGIVFNMTSKQMKSAVNQRIFDVPACKTFLVTDYKNDLEEIFDLKNEMVCFYHIDEIPELIKYYLKNPDKKEKIATSAYKRIIKSETYQHRLRKMIDILRLRYH